MFKLDSEKAEEPEIKLPISAGSWKKQESSRKTSISALLTMPKPLTVWITINCGKFWKRWAYQITWPASWKICMQVMKQQLELDIEQQTGSKLDKEYVKAVYRHLAYLTYMQSTSWETPDWKKHKLESRLSREISIISDMQMTPPLQQKVKSNWRASWKWKRRVKKLAQNSAFRKLKIMASGPITSRQIDGETVEIMTDFIFGTPKSLQVVTVAMKLKTLAPWKESFDQSRQHVEKQRHYFINKGPSSQSYGFSSSHVWKWELDHKESWATKNWCFGEDSSFESLGLQGDQTSQS